MLSEVIEALDENGAGLRIEFIWHKDRFCHGISRIDGSGGVQPLLESLEGIAADDWPTSPPLQSLTVHRLPSGQPAALLVGMAGRSHWSASVEPATGQPRLLFDIACRHSGHAKALGSCYQTKVDVAELSIVAEDAAVSYTNETAKIEPNMASANVTTSRWRYSICLAAHA